MILKETVGAGAAGMRLDDGASLLFRSLSKSRIRGIIELGGCAVNGVMCRVASRRLREGDSLVLGVMEPGRFRELVLSAADILYEDGDFLAVGKPAGFSSQRTPYQLKGTLEHAVGVYLKGQGIDGPVRIVHRLDRGTSGVMLFPKSRTAAALLSKRFREGEVEKVYLALARGEAPALEWIVDAPIAKVGPARYGAVRPGKEAKTEFRVAAQGKGAVLLEARPLTGRTHQIRVHLALSGLPIVGDSTYDGPPGPRLMLHCAAMAFVDQSGKRVDVSAPVDGEFAAACRGFAVTAGGGDGPGRFRGV